MINFIHQEWHNSLSEQSHTQCPCPTILMMGFALVSIFCSESFWITQVDELSVFP